MNKKPICVNIGAMDRLIDYLLAETSCDTCGKCAYYKEPNPNEEYTPCGHENECKDGMIKYFAGVNYEKKRND